MINLLSSALLLVNLLLQIPEPKFEGILGKPRAAVKHLTHLAPYYLPYNPIILHIGAADGIHTLELAHQYPDGFLFAIEPHPVLYEKLISHLTLQSIPNIKPEKIAFTTFNGSHLYELELKRLSSATKAPKKKLTQKAQVKVSCYTVDEWCSQNNLPAIDFIYISTNGHELPILKHAVETLKKVKVVCTKTFISPPPGYITHFHQLQNFLKMQGFEMLAHWYLDKGCGEATFIRQEIFNSLYR